MVDLTSFFVVRVARLVHGGHRKPIAGNPILVLLWLKLQLKSVALRACMTAAVPLELIDIPFLNHLVPLIYRANPAMKVLLAGILAILLVHRSQHGGVVL